MYTGTFVRLPGLLCQLGQWVLLGCCLPLLSVGSADAQSRTPIKVGGWSGGPVFAGAAKQVQRCVASTSNPQGIVIRYAIDRDYRWQLAFSNPTWSFSPGFELSMFLRLGEKTVIRARATVSNNQQLDIRTEDDLELFAGLWSANKLQVTAGGLSFEYELVSSNEVLSALLQCIRGSSSSAASKNRSHSVGTSSTREEVQSLASEIISFARIRDAQMLGIGPVGSAGWKAGLVTSTVDVLALPGVARIEDVTARFIKDELNKCRAGVFVVGAVQEVDKAQLARTYSVCPGTDATTFAYTAAIKRAQGGYYVLQSAAEGGGFAGVLPQQVGEMDARLRPAFVLAVNKVEQQPAPNSAEPSPPATPPRRQPSPERASPEGEAGARDSAPTFTSPFGRY